MTPAACKAVYSDWKLIRTRSCVQIVFEVPVEQAGEAYDALGGMPDPSKSVWCAIARMNGEGVVAPDKSDVRSRETSTETPPHAVADNAPRGAKKWRDMAPAQQAGILANDAQFQRFATEIRYGTETARALTAEDTAEFIRVSCKVGSRSEILPDTAAAACWDNLVARFRAWELSPQVGAD